MNLLNRLFFCVFFLALLLAMTACGGGGSNSSTTTTTQTTSNPVPSITSLSPGTTTVGAANLQITVTGSGFISSSTASWNGSARPTTFVSATQLTMTLQASDVTSTGSGQVTVTNPSPGGGSSSASAFAVVNPAPVVSSTSPTSLAAGTSATTLTVNGSGFVSSSVVMWNGTALTTTFVSSTQLQASVAANSINNGATVQVTVANPTPGGGTSAPATLPINNPVPVILASAPALYVTDANMVVTLTGTGFVPSSSAQWNGAARTTAFVDSTHVAVTLTTADLANTATGAFTVVNPAPGGGTSSSLAADITYASPSIVGLSPNAAVMGTPGATVTVSGAGFVPASTVQWNGTALAVQYVTSGIIRASIPAANLASNGTAQITVTNPTPGGGTSGAKTFAITTYPVPTVSSISPQTLYVNSPDTTVYVYGTGFQPVSSIQVNGTDLPSTLATSYMGKFLFATIPASYFSSVGDLQITVTTPPPSGGTSNAVLLPVTPSPSPTISWLSPSLAAVGSGAFNLTVTGSNFVPTSVVQWNGQNRPTTYSNGSSLTATISAADVASFSTAQVTVYTPPPGGGTTTPLPFSTYLALPTNDMVYNPTDQLLYASVPSSAGTTLGNSVVSIDPNTGIIGSPIWVGSEPNKLALSSDGTTLWVGLDGAGAVRKVDLTTMTAGLQFSLGGGNGVYNSPATASSIAVMPGFPNTIAVGPSSSTRGITIYDNGVARPKTYSGVTAYAIAFSSNGDSLYTLGYGYAVLTIDSTGVASGSIKNSNLYANSMAYDSGRVYLSNGSVLDASTGNQLGVFSVSANQQANGPVTVDSVVGRAFILINPNYGNVYNVNAYDLTMFTLKGSAPAATLASSFNGQASFLRWGQDGLAFRTPTQIFIFRTSLVRDLSASIADLGIAATVAGTSATGADVTYQLTVTNNGPVAATPAVLIDNLPSGAVLKSATPSQGTCSGAMVIRCNLGTLNASGNAAVQIVATLLTPGTATNTATVSAAQGDSDLTNNTVKSDTTVTGNAYAPVPVLTSISPEFVSAGSSMFTLTASGYGFSNGATINWNGAALATTFVDSTQLTAQVDATKVASLGWAWVNISNPAPGGGSSGSLPLSTFKSIDLSSNHIVFDPYTRKIFASVPGAATQVSGNSIVAIDPMAGTLGTPMFVGSEPNRLTETADGKYLYIGLDGAKSLTRVDLTTMTQGSTYPLNVNANGGNAPVVRSIAVMPGNNDTLAVDTGSWTGIGVLDISGSTATFRSMLTGPYTGSSLIFPDAATVYSYDVDTSGSTFNRWKVGTTGLTPLDESTLFGLGGFSGSFAFQNGLIYGVAGGVADPTTTPPSQIGRYIVNTLGLNQSLQTSGVAVDTAANRVFFTGSSTAGSSLPYVVSFDRQRFNVLDVVQLPGGSLTGTDLLRWGRDGLAWQNSSWPYGTTSGTITIVRGPWVLPQWGTTNPVATATASAPANIGAGAGNIMLTVTGTNFVPGAVVYWNGNERTTTYVDSTQLKVAIPASDVGTAGSATLTIGNPGATASNSITFTIN